MHQSGRLELATPGDDGRWSCTSCAAEYLKLVSLVKVELPPHSRLLPDGISSAGGDEFELELFALRRM